MFHTDKIAAIFFAVLLLIPITAAAQGSPGGPAQGPGIRGGMMGGGPGTGSMMGPGVKGSTPGPAMGRMGMISPVGLRSMLHRWGMLFFVHRADLGITDAQSEKIDAIVRDHWKSAIRNNADRQILLLDIQEALLKSQTDLGQVEKNTRALHSLEADLDVEGVRTLQKLLAVLTPEQQTKMKAFFREMAFARATGMPVHRPGMMSPGMRGGMMGPGMQGSRMTGK
jgi:Spy/CpxP family protein refolding chaperone